jgi:mannose-6-phosphate isomerase-like protein (cupin superfamily)
MGVLHRYIDREGGFAWEDLRARPYVGDSGGVGRRVDLLGAAEGVAGFALRYFELPPGSASTLDRHAHDHGIVILKGRARIRLGANEVEAGYGDVLYIPPHEEHQLWNPGPETLGFLCIRTGGA